MNDKKLTIEEANRISNGLVTVSVDPVDAELWRVEDDDAVETHEPMTEAEWERLLTEWGGMGDDPAKDVLAAALREYLSPQAVVAIAAFLQPATTKSAEVNRQIQWFAELLTEVVGGGEEHDRLCEEIGL